MENVVEIVDIQKVKEVLENTPYQKLSEVLKENGVEGAWKPGIKKADIIKNALELYKKTREDMRNEKEDEEKDVENKVTDNTAENIIQSTAPKNPDKLIPEYAKTGLIKGKFSKEQLEINLKKIKLNLKNGVPAQRAILLAKMQEIEDLLSKEE